MIDEKRFLTTTRFPYCFSAIAVSGQKAKKESTPAAPVRLTEVKWHGAGCYKIEIPVGTVYFEKDNGVSGFKNFIDNEGKDWVASYLPPGPNGDFRGFSNSVGNFGHAGRNSSSKTTIVDDKTEGDHVVLESTNSKERLSYTGKQLFGTSKK